jgi:hypothetical protein
VHAGGPGLCACAGRWGFPVFGAYAAGFKRMSTWSKRFVSMWRFTLHGPGGSLGSVETGETQFVVGTETAADV